MLPCLSKLSIRDDASVECGEPAEIGMEPSQDIDNLGLTTLANIAAERADERDMEEQITAKRREIAQEYDKLKTYQNKRHNLQLPERFRKLHSRITHFGENATSEMWNAMTHNQRLFYMMAFSSQSRPVVLYLLQTWHWFLLHLPTWPPLTDANVHKLWAGLVRRVLDKKLASGLDKKIKNDDRTVKTNENYTALMKLVTVYQYVNKNILNIKFEDSEDNESLTPHLVDAMHRATIHINTKFFPSSVVVNIEQEDVDDS